MEWQIRKLWFDKETKHMLGSGIYFVCALQLRNGLFGIRPRLTSRHLSRMGRFFVFGADPLHWAPLRGRRHGGGTGAAIGKYRFCMVVASKPLAIFL